MRTLQSELVEKGLSKKQKEQTTNRNPQSEKLSRRELEDLMGMNRQTYRRVNGAIRRK